MNVLIDCTSAVISFGASVIGAICGIGGGIIIKPALDTIGVASVSTVSFLSSCTVLSMSLYSVGRALIKKEDPVDLAMTTPLGIGAAAGGIVGNLLFSFVKNTFADTARPCIRVYPKGDPAGSAGYLQPSC